MKFKKVFSVLLVVAGVLMVISLHPGLFLPGCILLLCGGLIVSSMKDVNLENVEVALAQLYSELEDVKNDVASLAIADSTLLEGSSNMQKSMSVILPFVSKLDDFYKQNNIFGK